MNEDILIGGNHLAGVLVHRLGGDFATRFPPTMPSERALSMLAGDTFDIWVCWAAIMRHRDE